MIRTGAALLAVIFCAALVAAARLNRLQAGAAVPGAALTRGMQLVYASGGREQAPWVVDSVDLRASWADRKSCAYIRFGRTDVRRLCVAGDTLFAWNEVRSELSATRPIAQHMTLRLPSSSGGGYVIYETGAPERATVSGRVFSVLPTTVTTYDATGRATRRLRERYVLALATALGGVFEVPDSAASGGWIRQREFALIRIDPGR